jgi:hypothetical protein
MSAALEEHPSAGSGFDERHEKRDLRSGLTAFDKRKAIGKGQ